MTAGMPRELSMDPAPLEGLRIAVTAADLEQLEHRGIAAYSRNLIKALSRAGAEAWLITEFDPKLEVFGSRKLPKATQRLLQAAKILDALNAGHSSPELKSYAIESDQPPGIKKIRLTARRLQKRLWELLSAYIPTSLIPAAYRESKMTAILVHEHQDNPYLRQQRLDYLDGITGILCAPRFFAKANWLASRSARRGVSLCLQSFDALITTCPIKLDRYGLTPVLQTIHDLIPIEYARHGESPVAFTRRLEASVSQIKLFVSAASRSKYEIYIGKSTALDAVVVQPPSLQAKGLISSDRLGEQPAGTWKWLPDRMKYPGTESTLKTKPLKPLKYFLFNSSIEPRKNTIFLVKAFLESKLAERGYSLCITGAFKHDSYSNELKHLIGHNPYILITDYIDESTKFELYHKAAALVSPSVVEGFGIPVLDAACIGLPVIASETESHREIQSLYDFESYITLARTIKTTSWARLLHGLADQYDSLEHSEICSLLAGRIKRYPQMQTLVEQEFAQKIQNIILGNIKTSIN